MAASCLPETAAALESSGPLLWECFARKALRQCHRGWEMMITHFSCFPYRHKQLADSDNGFGKIGEKAAVLYFDDRVVNTEVEGDVQL